MKVDEVSNLTCRGWIVIFLSLLDTEGFQNLANCKVVSPVAMSGSELPYFVSSPFRDS
jgi:hypothetical protein